MSDHISEHEFDEPENESDPTVSTHLGALTHPGPLLPATDGPLSSLNEEQRTRVGALNMAKPLITEKSMLGSNKPPDVGDLLRLARWILDGSDEPLYPYTMNETVILGPDVTLGGLGDFITWKGMRYHREEEE